MKSNVKNNQKDLDQTDIEDPYEYWEMTTESMRDLFKGIIKRTINDLTGNETSPRDYDIALNWLINNDYNYCYISFPILCEAFEIEPSYMRKKIYDMPEVKERLTNQGILEDLLKRNKV